ncbi:MAG: MFS transporter [Thermomicrobiales bacterium]
MFSLGSCWSRTQGLSIAQRVAVISFFGQLYFFVPVMTPYLRGEGLSMAQIAGLQTMLLWAQLLMEVPTGVLADRLEHRRSYQVAFVLSVGAEISFLFAQNYGMFLLSQVIAGTGFAFASGSVDAYVYESLPTEKRTQGMQRARG